MLSRVYAPWPRWMTEVCRVTPAPRAVPARGRPFMRRSLLAVAAALMLVLAACSAGGTASPAPAPSGPSYEVRVASIGGLGSVLVDGTGYALYAYQPDGQAGRSTCYGLCAINWPPLVLPAGVTLPTSGPGVRADLLGTTTRTDGSRQVTYAGRPLYRWALDTRPGEALGQAVDAQGGWWYTVDADGALHTQ